MLEVPTEWSNNSLRKPKMQSRNSRNVYLHFLKSLAKSKPQWPLLGPVSSTMLLCFSISGRAVHVYESVQQRVNTHHPWSQFLFCCWWVSRRRRRDTASRQIKSQDQCYSSDCGTPGMTDRSLAISTGGNRGPQNPTTQAHRLVHAEKIQKKKPTSSQLRSCFLLPLRSQLPFTRPPPQRFSQRRHGTLDLLDPPLLPGHIPGDGRCQCNSEFHVARFWVIEPPNHASSFCNVSNNFIGQSHVAFGWLWHFPSTLSYREVDWQTQDVHSHFEIVMLLVDPATLGVVSPMLNSTLEMCIRSLLPVLGDDVDPLRTPNHAEVTRMHLLSARLLETSCAPTEKRYVLQSKSSAKVPLRFLDSMFCRRQCAKTFS